MRLQIFYDRLKTEDGCFHISGSYMDDMNMHEMLTFPPEGVSGASWLYRIYEDNTLRLSCGSSQT